MDAAQNAAEQASVAQERLDRLRSTTDQLTAADSSADAITALRSIATELASANAAQVQALAAVTPSQPDLPVAKRHVATAVRHIATAKAQLAQVPTTADPLGLAEATNNATLAAVESEKGLEATQVATRAAETRKNLVRTRTVHGTVIVLLPAAAVVAFVNFDRPDIDRTASLIFGVSVVVLALLTLLVLGGDRGLLKPLTGADNRVSTSRVQLALWTVAVGFAMAFLTGRVLWEGASLGAVLKNERLGEYLLLIGGPFAASVLAKLSVTWKMAGGTLQKTTATEPTITQALTDDSGNADLVDAQYLVFNFVALAYFGMALAQRAVLPDMPDVLLGLTSAAAATYTANKVAEQNAPFISAVSPTWCRPGQRVRVAGSNFLAGVDPKSARRAVVLVEGHSAELIPRSTTNTEIVVDLPLDAASGPKQLTVQTAANVMSAPYTIYFVSDKPVLFGSAGQPHVPGQSTTIKGRNLLPERPTAQDRTVRVVVRDLAVAGIADAEGVTFVIPSAIPSDTDVTVTVERDGVKSDPITIHTA